MDGEGELYPYYVNLVFTKTIIEEVWIKQAPTSLRIQSFLHMRAANIRSFKHIGTICNVPHLLIG
jgi:hypothetical protein